MLPPPRRSISGTAPRDSAISEYALMSSEVLNPAREVWTNGAESSSRAANAVP
jgi:hypothetical protein